MPDNKMTKAVGEHWVCAMLARHGWAPALTCDGIEQTDILAVGTHLPDRPTVEIQVKTATDTGERTTWLLGGVTSLTAVSVREWLVLVLLPKVPLSPRAFIVPRDHVSAATWIVHENWRTDPAVPPGQRNAGIRQARIQVVIWKGYEDRWDLLVRQTAVLGTSTDEVPVLLPSWLRHRAGEERVGLPSGQPWNGSMPQW